MGVVDLAGSRELRYWVCGQRQKDDSAAVDENTMQGRGVKVCLHWVQIG